MMILKKQLLSKGVTSRVREMSSVATVVNKAELAQLKSAPGKKILYFSNKWHPSCKELLPVVNNMSVKHPEISIIKIDNEIFTEVSADYGVKLVPYFVFLSGDKVVSKYHAAKCTIEYDLKNHVAALESA